MELSLFKQAFKRTWLVKLLQEKVFSFSFLLAIFTSFIAAPKLSYIDFKVIFCLFNLMVVLCAFEDLKIMDKAAISIINKCGNLRLISLTMISLTFFCSMLVTNDVALLTFVPLTLKISRKTDFNPLKLIIFQTLAANIGSSLTPMGNPQNLFLFTHYGITALQFFKLMLPFVFLGGLCLMILGLTMPKSDLDVKFKSVKIKNKNHALSFGILFLIIVLSVFNLLSYSFAFLLTIALVLLIDRNYMKKVDFLLLATFVCFFIFIGNLSHIEFINEHLKYLLNTDNRTFFTSIILSQFVSNVPASILIANFTDSWKQVLLGVNIGGMGTLIASMASVISYKLYINEAGNDTSSSYLFRFEIYNCLGLMLFIAINYSLLHFYLI